jgi:hypothetical protein
VVKVMCGPTHFFNTSSFLIGGDLSNMFGLFMCWDDFTEHFHISGPTDSTAPCRSAAARAGLPSRDMLPPYWTRRCFGHEA